VRMARAKVTLPDMVGDTFSVYINGVPQERGKDYSVEGRCLVFERELHDEGKLGWMRWLSMFLGIAGHYAKNDKVDVMWELDGRQVVTSGLEVVPEQPSGTAAAQ
jgi:hypothetical protein